MLCFKQRSGSRQQAAMRLYYQASDYRQDVYKATGMSRLERVDNISASRLVGGNRCKQRGNHQ
jgi:hypothetical protein